MPPKKAEKGGAKKGGEVLTDEQKFALIEDKLEKEKQNLAVELTFQSDKLKQLREENLALLAEVGELKGKLKKQTVDSIDILKHKQSEISDKVEKMTMLEARVKDLEGQLRERDESIKALRQEQEASRKRLDDQAKLAHEKVMLEEAVHRQDQVIADQDKEIDKMKKQIQAMDERLAEAKKENGDLVLKASGTTKLSILFGEPWLLSRSRHRLGGEVPLDREENSLNHMVANMGTKLLVLYGGTARGEGLGRDLCVANMDKCVWERVSGTAKQLPGRSGHSATAMGKNKLVVFGGRRQALLNDLHFLNTDTMKWNTPQVKGTIPSREGHAACAVREEIVVFGGHTGVGTTGLASDVYHLKFETMQWVAVTTLGGAPSPRRGHTISASEDGRKLWVFGGFDGAGVLGDLHVLEMDRQTWTTVSTTGVGPSPREGHAATVVNKYFMVCGGHDGQRRLSDAYVLDTETLEWECLSEAADAGGAPMQVFNLKQRGAYSAFHGNKLITIKPNREEKLDEMEVLEFTLPEDIEGLKKAKNRGDDEQSDQLELCDEATTTSNAIEVTWRPPAKYADRVDHYKLMMATNTGVVKEVCQGKYERFKVTGLRANAEYIFCVKALYDDGKHMWSESKAFVTRYGASTATKPSRPH
mmetsp:Transcript_16072/g.54796  ORF Transcript_16072/g.54796 Transcript_16072/m.54796 type:complete len:644 (+) Transcript_16072:153-2084(+)